MSAQFTPCPACGAVGEVNSTCQFCGTTILLKEGATPSDARIIQQRTITPQQYAEKISIYHKIESLGDKISKVAIGQQEGIINLNGDLIYPLGNERIAKGSIASMIIIGNKFLNLENFEFINDPYLNNTVLEKITTLSKAIMDDYSTEGTIEFDFSEDMETRTCLVISNSHMYEECEFVTPQLMISFYDNAGYDSQYFYPLYKRFTSCDEFELFDEFLDEYGERAPITERHHYLLCGNDAEKCCRIVLRIYQQIHNISPEDIVENDHMYCCGDCFDEKDNSNLNSNENYSNSNGSSNENGGGCLGMLALLLSVGGAGIYGLTQLISNLIA